MANYNKRISERDIRIGEVRFSYASVFTPKEGMNGGQPKYCTAIIIPKTDTQTLALIKAGIDAALEKGKADMWGGKIPNGWKNPLRDGDEDRPDDENYKGCMFFNCSTKLKPGVKVLTNGKLLDAAGEDEFYSGCYGLATVQFFPFSQNGSKGVGIGLGNVCKTRDGERLAGGRAAEADFGDLGSVPELPADWM